MKSPKALTFYKPVGKAWKHKVSVRNIDALFSVVSNKNLPSPSEACAMPQVLTQSFMCPKG